MPKAIIWGVSLLVAIALFIILAPFTIISPQERGVVVRASKIVGTMEPGWHYRTPILENIVKMDVSTQKDEVPADAASKDLQSVSATIAVNYSLDPSHVDSIYREFKQEYNQRIISPAVQEAVKAATALYNAEELITKREAVKDSILGALKERLEPNNIFVHNVSIVNFDFSAEFNQSVEAKVTAEQNALAAENNLKAAQYDAQALRAKSEAANNDKYIELQRLEVERAAIEKWNGQLPTNFVPGSAIPFINLQQEQ